LRPCRSPYPADCPSSLDGSSLGHKSLHPLRSSSAVSACPLTGFREVRLTRQQVSHYVTACTLAGAADQSPPTHSRRQARPFTAELAPTEVSPSQSLLSLLGPTTYCRGGIHTRSPVKERRLHTKGTKRSSLALRFLLCKRSAHGSTAGFQHCRLWRTHGVRSPPKPVARSPEREMFVAGWCSCDSYGDTTR